MIKLTSVEKFEIGTVFAFFALAFYTIVPYLFSLNVIFIPFYIYKVLSGAFLLVTMFFYLNSLGFLHLQIKVFGVIFLLFGVFQLFFDEKTTGISVFVRLIPVVIGIVLLLINFLYFKSRKSI